MDYKLPQNVVWSGLCNHLFNFLDSHMVPGISYLVLIKVNRDKHYTTTNDELPYQYDVTLFIF